MHRENPFESKEFFDDIANSVRNVLYASFPTMSAQEREDIEQEVKFRIWRSLARGKKVDNFRSYVWKAVYNAALNAINRRLRYCVLEDAQEADGLRKTHHNGASEPEIALEDREMKEIVKKAIKKLKDRRRTVVELHFMGLHRTEIAHILDLNENQARHLLYRGLKDLADIVQPQLKGASGAALAKVVLSSEGNPE